MGIKEESEAYHLLLRQISVMFHALKRGGCAVVKIGRVLSDTTAEIVYLIYRAFGEFALVKPVASDPGTWERYLLLKGFKGVDKDIRKMMRGECGKFKGDARVSRVVGDVWKEDETFVDYVQSQNMKCVFFPLFI